MPLELLKAHRMFDTAVMKLYNFKSKGIAEAEIVAKLMERYQGLVIPQTLIQEPPKTHKPR